MRFGYTMYDVARSFGWQQQVRKTDASIITTRVLCNNAVIRGIEALKKKVIVHALFSGFEGTEYEPSIPDLDLKLEYLHNIVAIVPNPAQVVLRFNPLIPLKANMRTVAYILNRAPSGIRVKVDIIKLSNKLLDDLASLRGPGKTNLQLPWPNEHPPIQEKRKVIEFLKNWRNKIHSFSFCCEALFPFMYLAGCISRVDYDILNLPEDYQGDYEPENPDCACCQSRVNLYNEIAVDKCIWNHNL